MVSATRRLSISVEDLARKTDGIETSEQKGLLGGPIGRWLEQEWDYQKHMLPGVDNMWFLLERGSDFNPVCSSIFTFKEEVSLDALVRQWNAMTERYPVYRQRVTGLHRRFHTVRLREDPTFDVHNHVRVIRMEDGKNGKRELEDEMAKFMAKDWDYNRPLWEIVVIYNYRDGMGAKSAMLSRAHHSLSDGQGLIVSQLSTTSAGRMMEEKMQQAAEKAHNIEHGQAKLSDFPVPGVGEKLKPLDPYVPSVLVSFLFIFLSLVLTLINVVYDWYIGARVLLLFLTFKRRTLLYDGPRPEEKEFSFSDVIRLEEIKEVQTAFGGNGRKITLNDVMCAVVVKTVSEYCEKVEGASDKRISLFIPISVRRPSDLRMKNLSTGTTVYFPSARPSSTPTKALIAGCHDEMMKIKHSLYPRLGFVLLEWLYRVPALFPQSERLALLLDWMLESFHGVLTNVPGPPASIDVEGTEVLCWTASPPQGGKGTLGIGMISYNGGLILTVTADKTEKYDGIARYLTKGFVDTFREFLQEVRTLKDGQSRNVHAVPNGKVKHD